MEGFFAILPSLEPALLRRIIERGTGGGQTLRFRPRLGHRRSWRV